tara:strand:- start:41 stop:1669 length:1629 start_codon:yes stop_codon:yes gene_type:complete
MVGILDPNSYAGYAAEGKRLAVDLPEVTAMDAARFIAEATPIIGDAMAAKEVWDEATSENPNWALVGALGGATLLGLIPGVGDAAAKAVKAGARGLLDIVPSDAIYAGKSLAEGDFQGIFDAFGDGVQAKSLSAASSNVPRQMPSNNVLDPVDRLTPEQLAGAVPFERASGFAEPRVGGGRAKDPALFSPFAKPKQTGVAPSDWSVSGRRLSSETEAPRLKSAENLKDAGFTDMFGFVADSTMGDTIFDRINDVELPRSVMQQGGHEFGDNIDGRGFASDDVALGTKEKVWRKTVEEGGKPVVTPMTMGTAGGDFSMHETMNLAQLIGAMSDSIDPNFVPLRGAAKNNERFLPEGMGLLSPELPAYLSNLKGGERAAFVKSLDTKAALDAGVPSVGAVRWATTAPELAGQPLLSSGFRAFEPETGGFFNYGDTHASYNATIPRVGDNMTMGETRPWYLQFPDEAYPKMVASTPKGANMLKTEAMPKDMRAFQMNPNLSQAIDNQWVETNMMYDEILRNQGKEAADMYALDALVNRAQMSGNY